MREKIARYRRWQDRHAHLFGKLLLREALKRCSGADTLSGLQYTSYGRPYLPGPVDFNLSHSGKYVVCAISGESNLGVDIEEVKPIQLADFANVLRLDEVAAIQSAPDALQSFYRLWTIKESVIKAEGRGLSIPLKDILVDHHSASLYDKVWYLHDLKIDGQYSTFLTTNTIPKSVKVTEIFY